MTRSEDFCSPEAGVSFGLQPTWNVVGRRKLLASELFPRQEFSALDSFLLHFFLPGLVENPRFIITIQQYLLRIIILFLIGVYYVTCNGSICYVLFSKIQKFSVIQTFNMFKKNVCFRNSTTCKKRAPLRFISAGNRQ